MSTDFRHRSFTPRLELDEAERYGPTSHASESALFHGYRAGSETRVEQRLCACGGMVHADPDAPSKGVAQHNSTGRHRAWRSAHGFDLPLKGEGDA